MIPKLLLDDYAQALARLRSFLPAMEQLLMALRAVPGVLE